MSRFNYTLPSGAEYVVRGPAGATQAQADRIFYEQVAAGSLVSYESGQTLTSPATQLTKFELSRLDRGTAGVDTIPILAIVQGLPVATSIPNLTTVPLNSPIDEGDIVNIKGDDLGPNEVGPLSAYQVQKLLAQIANLVDQESDQISQDKGIGQYGFTCYALETAGYVKPGTSLRFFAVNPEDFVAVMSSPSVWTGRNGVYGLSDVLSDAVLQNNIQTQLMQQGYDSLVANGTITKPNTSGVQFSAGQVFTNSGLQSIRALTSASLLGNLGSLNGIVQNALTSSTSLNRLLTGTNLNLSTIGSGAVNSLTAGLGNLGNLANLNFASIGSTLTNQINAGVGALITNASKFGAQATELWAKAGNLGSISGLTGALSGQLGSLGNLANLGSLGNLGNLGNLANLGSLGNLGSLQGQLTGALSGQLGSLTSSLNSITSNLTNLVPGSLSNLTSSLNIFGQAGSFATNFANPLSNLSNLGNLSSLGNLTNLGNLSNLGNLANLGNLGNLANLGNLGNLANLGSLGSLGSLSSAFGSLGSFASIGAVGDLFGGGGDLVSGTKVAAGFSNTVNRATVDAAWVRVAGSSKIPVPVFQYPSLASLAPRLDIQQAQNFLRSQLSSVSGTFGQTVTI